MSNAMIEKHSRLRMLQAQYAAFITEQYVVTDQVISTATTARLEAIDLEVFRWKGVPASTGLGPAAGALRWAGASARNPC